jgi:hypothetical protein
MNDDALEDLKQFIDKTIALNISDVRSDIKKLDDKLSAKIDDLSTSVANAMDTTNEVTDTQLKDHEQRINLLEQKAA